MKRGPPGYGSKPSPARSAVALFCFCAASLFAMRQCHALTADEIALVINDKIPASRELAEFYAQQRHIPPARIIALELDDPDPSHPADEISATDYESKVAAPVREFLRRSRLETRVKCLVTFWGVPLRVGARSNTRAEAQELAAVDDERKQVQLKAEASMEDLETLARAVNPSKNLPKMAPTVDPQSLIVRSDRAVWTAAAAILAMPEGKTRSESAQRLVNDFRDLSGPVVSVEKLAVDPLAALLPQKITAQQLASARQRGLEIEKQASLLDLSTPQGRAQIRRLGHEDFGSLVNLKVLQTQFLMLQTGETQASVGSELALIWWPPYPRVRWQTNPLLWKQKQAPAGRNTLMVCRLDGPDVQTVHRLIATSVQVEQNGLQGAVALDARGKPPTEPYGIYDQELRNLAAFLKAKTSLKVVLDNREELLPEHSVKDVALYCGWYSLRHYVPCCQFSPGAVGFHVASFELTTLHNPADTGWVQGLLKDGVVGTLGPVNEPYLQSFPAADEFFPLLLTGKLTLAEVYWKTIPMVSWMQELVGDPLYRPYAAHPPLAVSDLPAGLRATAEARGN